MKYSNTDRVGLQRQLKRIERDIKHIPGSEREDWIKDFTILLLQEKNDFTDFLLNTNITSRLVEDTVNYSILMFGDEYQVAFCYKGIFPNYCRCKETDESYNKDMKCCGINCDWYSPCIYISKGDTETELIFDGLQKDLWMERRLLDSEE